MIAYKLVRKLKDGSLSSLFINKKKRLPINEWMIAEDYKTSGYAHRPGWHCTFTPHAPHLSTKDRVWVRVKIRNYETFNRPKSQGGRWLLAQEMKIIEEVG